MGVAERMASRPRVVTLGYQGFGNLGDEAILSGIERLLDGHVTVTAVVGGSRAAIAAYPAVPRLASDRSWPTLAAVRALRRADGLLLAGGGLLHDHWTLVVPRYLAWLVAAKLLGRPVVWLGVGVGPFRRRALGRLAGLTLRLSRLVLVRDQASARTATAAGGRVDGVIPDPALFLDRPAAAERHGLLIIVRAPIHDDAKSGDALADALAAFATAHAADDVPPVIVSFAGTRDDAFARLVENRLRAAGVSVASVEQLGPDPEAGLARLARAEAVVSVRLHGLLLSVLAGTPCAVVAYDEKIEGVAEDLALGEVTVSLAGIDGPAIAAALDRARDPAVRSALAARVDSMRADRARIAAAVRGAIEQ
jgi:polysaccharide pyruvyl transferase CsaB